MRVCRPNDGRAGTRGAVTQQTGGEPGGEEQTVLGPHLGLAAHELPTSGPRAAHELPMSCPRAAHELCGQSKLPPCLLSWSPLLAVDDHNADVTSCCKVKMREDLPPASGSTRHALGVVVNPTQNRPASGKPCPPAKRVSTSIAVCVHSVCLR